MQNMHQNYTDINWAWAKIYYFFDSHCRSTKLQRPLSQLISLRCGLDISASTDLWL